MSRCGAKIEDQATVLDHGLPVPTCVALPQLGPVGGKIFAPDTFGTRSPNNKKKQDRGDSGPGCWRYPSFRHRITLSRGPGRSVWPMSARPGGVRIPDTLAENPTADSLRKVAGPSRSGRWERDPTSRQLATSGRLLPLLWASARAPVNSCSEFNPPIPEVLARNPENPRSQESETRENRPIIAMFDTMWLQCCRPEGRTCKNEDTDCRSRRSGAGRSSGSAELRNRNVSISMQRLGHSAEQTPEMEQPQ